MKKPSKLTLSQHLLEEADRYNLYPQHVSSSDRWVRKAYDDVRRKLVEWRRTFAVEHDTQNDIINILGSRSSLDEFYCRDLLKKIPDIVDRTLNLKHLALRGLDSEASAYLSAAANCYILDLPEAAVALARAAVEDAIHKRLEHVLGNLSKDVARGDDLEMLIEKCCFRLKVLSVEGRNMAEKVRIEGNNVLHNRKAIRSKVAAEVIEAARMVILELASHQSARR